MKYTIGKIIDGDATQCNALFVRETDLQKCNVCQENDDTIDWDVPQNIPTWYFTVTVGNRCHIGCSKFYADGSAGVPIVNETIDLGNDYIDENRVKRAIQKMQHSWVGLIEDGWTTLAPNATSSDFIGIVELANILPNIDIDECSAPKYLTKTSGAL